MVIHAAVLLAAALVAPSDEIHVAKDWLVALRSTMHGGSTASDVERVLSLYADDVVYEHPRVGMRIEGKADVRQGMLRFLGAYAGGPEDVRFEVADLRSAPGVVVVDLQVSMKTRKDDGIADVQRRQLLVVHVKDGRITRVLDHW